MRYLSVEQRVLNIFKAALEAITTDNGFNTTVNVVAVTRDLPQRPPEDCTIYIVPIMTVPDSRCNARTYQTMTLEVWFYTQRIENQDLEYTSFLTDIRNALCYAYTDPTHPNPGMTGVVVTEVEAKPLYEVPGDDTVVGMLTYTLEYFTAFTDDRLWDDQVDQLVPVDE